MSKLIMGLLFSFMFLSLFFWWFSLSSSVSLMMVLIFSVFSVLSYSFVEEMKVPLFMIVLTLSGGLFVLVALVIMFFPDDYMKGATYVKKFIFSCSTLVFFGMLVSFFLMEEMELKFSEIKVWGNYVLVYIFLIVVLFLFLFVINWLVNPTTGSMFTKKKVSGVNK